MIILYFEVFISLQSHVVYARIRTYYRFPAAIFSVKRVKTFSEGNRTKIVDRPHQESFVFLKQLTAFSLS